MNIQEIQLDDKLPLVVITDSHCNLKHIQKVKLLYPFSKIICLGDITNLFEKNKEFNRLSIQYFIDNNIPCLKGNHEEHIAACCTENLLYQWRTLPKFDEHLSLFNEYKIEKHQVKYINNLPIGFRVINKDGNEFLFFHNRPKDLWSFTEEGFSDSDFKNTYPLTDKTKAVIIGHQHKNFTIYYEDLGGIRLEGLGALKFESYGLLYPNGSFSTHTLKDK